MNKQGKKTKQLAKTKSNSTSMVIYTSHTKMNPMPTRFLTRLRYADPDILFSLPVGPGLTDYKFNVNSLFQPNVTGGGHQPMGFDQLCAFYNRYRVHKTHFKVICAPQVGGATLLVALALTNTNTSYTALSTAAESTFGRAGYAVSECPYRNNGVINLAELNGKSKTQYITDDLTAGTVSTSPTETLELHCVVANQTGLSQPVILSVQFLFEAEFYDPVQLAQS